MGFAPYPLTYAGIDAQFQEAALNRFTNNWQVNIDSAYNIIYSYASRFLFPSQTNSKSVALLQAPLTLRSLLMTSAG